MHHQVIGFIKKQHIFFVSCLFYLRRLQPSIPSLSHFSASFETVADTLRLNIDSKLTLDHIIHISLQIVTNCSVCFNFQIAMFSMKLSPQSFCFIIYHGIDCFPHQVRECVSSYVTIFGTTLEQFKYPHGKDLQHCSKNSNLSARISHSVVTQAIATYKQHQINQTIQGDM